MQKRFSSFIFDFIFYVLIIFFITFIWIRKVVHNNVLIWIYSLSITLTLAIILSIIFKKKTNSYFLNKKESKEKAIILNQLIFTSKEKTNKFIREFFNEFKINLHKEFFTFTKNETKYIVFNSFDFENLSLKNLLLFLEKAEKEKCEKIYIFCSNFNKECSNIINNLTSQKVKLINYDNFYKNYMKRQNIYPTFDVKYEEKTRYKFKELLSIAFNKKKTKNYFFTGIVFLIGSIFLRYNIYYLVFTSIMFVFALFSYFNNIYNIKEIDDF